MHPFDGLLFMMGIGALMQARHHARTHARAPARAST